MTLLYFDSSALVKLLINERGTDLATQLWNACDAALSSRLAYPEVCAALGAAGRNHDLTDTEAFAAATQWETFWASMRPVELTPAVERLASELAVRHQLRGADAVHLASAQALDSATLVFAAWDKRLHRAATELGLAVAPARLD